MKIPKRKGGRIMQQNRWTATIEVLTIEEYFSKRETTKESRMVPLLWMS